MTSIKSTFRIHEIQFDRNHESAHIHCAKAKIESACVRMLGSLNGLCEMKGIIKRYFVMCIKLFENLRKICLKCERICLLSPNGSTESGETSLARFHLCHRYAHRREVRKCRDYSRIPAILESHSHASK